MKDRYKIKELQGNLAIIAGAYYNLGQVYPSGIYDGATKKAVKEVQGLLGIKRSGELDRETVKGIYSLASQIFAEKNPKGLLAFEAGRVYAYGDSADTIAVAQIMINRIAGVYKNIPATDINGIMDIKTVSALTQLRSVFRDVGSQLDARTWHRLLTLYYSVRSVGYGERAGI